MSRRTVHCVLALLALVVVWAFDRHFRFFDMAIYQGAVRWWADGGDLYAYQAPVRGALGFTYPPFAALLLMPAGLVPLNVAGWLNVLLSLLSLAAALAVVTSRAAGPGRPLQGGWALTAGRGFPAGRALLAGRALPVALVLVLALATEPVRQTLGLGQVNLVLFALVVLDLGVLGRAGSRWAGVGVGIATAVKLTPGLFIVYLLVTRRWRAAAVAGGTAAVLTAAAAVVAPRETMQYFGDLLWRTERVGAADAVANQSLAGLLARLSDSPAAPRYWWLALCAVAVVAGLRRAARAHAYGHEMTGLTLAGLTANLVTPVAWTHHLTFLPVALILLGRSGRRRDGVAVGVCYVLCVLSPVWWVADGPGGLLPFLAANTFVLMIIFLVWRLPVAGDAARRPEESGRRDGVSGVLTRGSGPTRSGRSC